MTGETLSFILWINDFFTFICRQRLVVAVDFGTTYSGYAYCWQDEYEKNITNPKILCNTWIGGKVIGEKAPTCVLFNSDKKFHSFGYDAVAFYEQNAHRENFRDWYYFEHFKMKLYNETVNKFNNTPYFI